MEDSTSQVPLTLLTSRYFLFLSKFEFPCHDTGGIAKHYVNDLKVSHEYKGVKIGFMDAFKDKGRVSPILNQIPIKVVLAEDIGTRGAQLLGNLLLRELREGHPQVV